MKRFRRHSLLFAILIVLFLLAEERIFLLSFLLCLIFVYLRTHELKTVLLLGMILLILTIPRYSQRKPEITQGRVTEVHERYIVVNSNRTRLLLYTDADVILDSRISFEAIPSFMTSSPSFYSFNFKAYCNSRGIYYSAVPTSIGTVRDSFSIRGHIQRAILNLEDETVKGMLNRILLGIRSEEDLFSSFLNDSGFSLSGILILLDRLLKQKLDRKQRLPVLIVCNALLALIYHFPLLLVQALIFRILRLGSLQKAEQTGVGLCMVLLLYPYAVTSASFLIPGCYRIASYLSEEKKELSLLLGMSMQSILFHAVNPVEMLLYPLLVPMLGLCWLIALVQLSVPSLNLIGCIQLLDRMLTWLNAFRLPGTMLGFGLIFFLMIVFTVRHHQKAVRISLAWFLFFQSTGLFHPLAEVTMINVGQGDSILIRMPLNSENYLIDTGKLKQWNTLSTMLDAKGIRKLNTLMITHSDNDHSGNQEAVIERYDPTQVITEHQSIIQNGRLRFYDLSTIQNEDENQSSLIHLFQLNGLSYLCMGDADSISESAVVQQYGSLDCDILKLSHHGSKTGSSEIFLDTVRPRLGLISSGAYRLYHHPSEETLQRLLKRHIPYLITREEGDISILCFPGFNLVITASGRISMLGRG